MKYKEASKVCGVLESAFKEFSDIHRIHVISIGLCDIDNPILSSIFVNHCNGKDHHIIIRLKEVDTTNMQNTIDWVLERVRIELDLPYRYAWLKQNPYVYRKGPLKIKNVIFNNPATIVFWEDGTKTVVKCQDGDVYDPEKGLAMAITKKALGNKGNYCNELKKWLEKYEPSDGPTVINLQIVGDKYREALDAWNEFIRRHGDPVPDGDNN